MKINDDDNANDDGNLCHHLHHFISFNSILILQCFSYTTYKRLVPWFVVYFIKITDIFIYQCIVSFILS